MDLPGYGCRIVGTGSALGGQSVPSHHYEDRLGLRRGWVAERTGVVDRPVATEGERTGVLGAAAARQALEDAEISAKELDLVICATMTAEMNCPATSQRIVADIGGVPCGAFDLTSACTGFLAGMHLAANGIRAGAYRNVLVVGSDVLSSIVNQDDPKMAALFGDAACAAVLSRADDPNLGIISQKLRSDGSQWAYIYQPRCAADLPPHVEEPERYGYLTMNGLAVYRFAIETLTRMVPVTLADAGMTMDDVDLVLLHQSNLRIVERVREALHLDASKCPTIIERTGNTSGGSLGVLLDDVRRDGRVRPGTNILLAAVGGGLTWGASIWRV
jgi:3-oxoacyl-[acyl-carrier-protein] synthase-3